MDELARQAGTLEFLSIQAQDFIEDIMARNEKALRYDS